MSDAIRTVMIRELECFVREVELFPDDRLLWEVVPGVTNSAGNLALHAAGNLQHFIGAILGGSGYVRNRDAEFKRRSGSRAELKDELIRARDSVDTVLSRMTAEKMDRPYPEPVGNRQFRTEDFLLHLATHLAFHLGQIGYLRRALTADPTTTGAVSNAVLALP